MKKTFLASLLALMIIVVGASPAFATFHGTVTYTWSHAGCTITAQSIVNLHDTNGWREALGRYKKSCGNFWVSVDYTRLYRNGVLVKANESDRYFALTTSYTGVVSGWDAQCPGGSHYASIRFKFSHGADSHTSGWIVLNSNSWSYSC